MATTVRVTAPYVTLKVQDATHANVLLGYYEGAIVENVDDESAQHHIDSGLAVKVSPDADPAAPPFMPQGADPVVPDSQLKSDAPAGNATLPEWQAYVRATHGDAALNGDDGTPLTRNELRTKYGD